MGEIENKFEEAKLLLKKAHGKLKSAHILMDNNQTDDVLSRCYYSVFHAAKASLLLLGEEPKSHSGLHTLFGLKIIKEGLLAPKYGKIFSQLFQARQTDDYELFAYYEKDEIKQFIKDAEDFVEQSEKLIQKLEKKQN